MAEQHAQHGKQQPARPAQPAQAAKSAGNGQEAPKSKPATTVNSVKMTDGRIVDFPGKRRLQKQTFITEDGVVTVQLDFVNGETRTFKPLLKMYPIFVGHGAEQKLGDEIAGLDDIDDAVTAIDDLIDNLNKGEWSQKREAGAMAGTSILVKAMTEYTGKPVETVKEFLKDKTPAEKAALRVSKIANKAGATIKSIVDRLEAEKVARGQKIDAGELLKGFAA